MRHFCQGIVFMKVSL